jgi:hypothetical protein
MTMLPARVEDGHVSAGALRLPFRHRADAREWTLALRPEDCALTDLSDPRAIPGIVDSVVDLGATCIATVVLGGGICVKAQVSRRRATAKGDNIGLVINRALVYRDGRAPIELTMSSQAEAKTPAVALPQEISA